MATHHFQPTRYYVTLGAHEPALTIADGDTVVTTTVDADGVDAAGRLWCDGANPQTGPFYVTGAEPGDTLAVHFDRLWPNRDTGYTRSMLATNVVDPAYVRSLPADARAYWHMDLQAGTAALPWNPDVTLPLAPMVGCFGVAPAGGEAISAATSGRHGGNMDYRGFVAGSTVYLPVAVPGALFTLGDGHAIQGAGEIIGTGIEVSFDVTFTVAVRKGSPIGWPRGEDAEFIFTCGNARPLDQALQHATTEMLQWLMADYGLDIRQASMLLGQCVQYEVGNVYDPAYTMVCKLPKALLATVTGRG